MNQEKQSQRLHSLVEKNMVFGGVSWVQIALAHWKVGKVKQFFKIGMGELILTTDLEDHGTYPIYSATESDKYFGYKSNLRTMLNRNDIVIPARGNSIGFTKLVREKSGCTQTTMYLKSKNLISSAYVNYFFSGFRKKFFVWNDTAIPQVTVDQVSNNSILIPPLSEQLAIAAYLDKVTATIDKQRDLLDRKKALLQQHKKAVIHQAVTKGLKVGVPMKPSGVDWIGDVPVGWKAVRYQDLIGQIRKRSGTGLSPGSISYGRVVYKDIDLIPSETLSTYQAVKFGDLLINPINLNYDLKSLRTAISSIDVCVSPAYIVAKPKSNVYTSFLAHLMYCFDCYEMKLLGAGVRQTIAFGDVSKSVVVVPPYQEQIAISKYLDRYLLGVNKQCELIDRKIELLGKLRESTIHEAVTKGVPASAV
jgi:type I restriction enzyme, S subunit